MTAHSALAQAEDQAEDQTSVRLTIRFFGTVQLHLNGRDLTKEIGAKPLALLAYLAVAAPRPVARTQLAGLLWPDKTEETARYRLRHLLWELRRQLGKAHLHADDEDCRLGGAGLWVDVIAFQAGITQLGLDQPQVPVSDVHATQQLVDLYQGDFFGRLKVREAPLFEEWVLVAQERFQLCYQQLLDRLAQAQLATGDEQGATQTLRRLVAADPLREQSYRALMLTYARLGDRAAALYLYTQCKLRLASELGVPPDPETTALQQQIASRPLDNKAPDLARALQHLHAGHYNEALASCDIAEAVAITPNTRHAITLLRAEIALTRGDPATAHRLIQTVRQALHPLQKVDQAIDQAHHPPIDGQEK